MNKAELYRKSNWFALRDSQQIMQEFVSVLKWRSDGRDSVLDAGCGPGNVTSEIILPILSPNIERLVGIDISEEMIDYARKTQIHPKLSFEVFNLEVELEKQTLNGIEPFHHIVSFYCCMWIRNQKTCLENFYKLLHPGGDILLLFMVQNNVYKVYRDQAQDCRWAEYLYDYENVLAYVYSENPREEFSSLLKECGFTEYNIRMEERTYCFDRHGIRNLFHSVNPFIDRIPAEKKEEYLDDLIDLFEKNNSASGNGAHNMLYTNMVAYAKK